MPVVAVWLCATHYKNTEKLNFEENFEDRRNENYSRPREGLRKGPKAQIKGEAAVAAGTSSSVSPRGSGGGAGAGGENRSRTVLCVSINGNIFFLQLFPRKCTWLYVINNTLMSLSGT